MTCLTVREQLHLQQVIVSAMGKTFHPEHFICHGCKKPITGGKFNQHEGKPYCEADFVEMYLKKCAACGKPIKDKMIIAMDKNWHEDHFVCEQCKKPLGGQSFVEKDGKAFCQPDYHELYSPRCHGCRKPITDTAIVALEERWHHQCFRCSKCGKPIMEKSFEVVDNKAICASCSEFEDEDQMVDALNKRAQSEKKPTNALPLHNLHLATIRSKEFTPPGKFVIPADQVLKEEEGEDGEVKGGDWY
ncbi:paxillin [Anabrus simplex]|uniref:paxillin n=1 Tax=Anabrus simplex TaxID=316456 RepID=UPI0035A35111